LSFKLSATAVAAVFEVNIVLLEVEAPGLNHHFCGPDEHGARYVLAGVLRAVRAASVSLMIHFSLFVPMIDGCDPNPQRQGTLVPPCVSSVIAGPRAKTAELLPSYPEQLAAHCRACPGRANSSRRLERRGYFRPGLPDAGRPPQWKTRLARSSWQRYGAR